MLETAMFVTGTFNFNCLRSKFSDQDRFIDSMVSDNFDSSADEVLCGAKNNGVWRGLKWK